MKGWYTIYCIYIIYIKYMYIYTIYILYTIYIHHIYIYTSWWCQPPWNILVKLGIFPQVGVNIKNIWNHHLNIYYIYKIYTQTLEYTKYNISFLMTNFTLAIFENTKSQPLFWPYVSHVAWESKKRVWAFTIEGHPTVGGWTNPLET